MSELWWIGDVFSRCSWTVGIHPAPWNDPEKDYAEEDEWSNEKNLNENLNKSAAKLKPTSKLVKTYLQKEEENVTGLHKSLT